jgi:hypothetical protein
MEEIEPPAGAVPARSGVGAGPGEGWLHSRPVAWARRHPWWSGSAGLLVLAIVVVRWANTRPGFDPYGWLTWGHQTWIGHLDTNAAPSWKPLPYIFTLPYALFGHYQLWLWMVTAVAIALSGMVFAARIAYRVVDAPAARRWAAVVAALFAALTFDTITQRTPLYSIWHYILSDQSDPMIVALCLAAIDMHLAKRYRWAFACGVLAGLGRPEVWALLGPYWIWLWLRQPQMRRYLVFGVVAMAFLWFGIPALTSRSAFVSADNAFYSGRRLHHDLIFGTIGRFLDLQPRAVEIAALVSLALAAWRRDRVTLAMAGMVVVWMVVEVAMVIHGWPGVPRYMFEPAGVLGVIAAIGLGRLLLEPPQLRAPVGAVACVAVAALVIGSLPTALHDARSEHRDIDQQRLRTHTLNLLTTEIDGFGGPGRFRPCGEPLTRLQYQSSVAWALHRNVANIGFKYSPAIASTRPIVLFTPYPQAGSGWQITALHQTVPSCRSLPTGS